MKTTNIVVMTLIGLFTTLTTLAQNNNVGIGTTTPDPSAVLEANSTTQGFLPPRMAGWERDAIISPAQGLMIYCTNCGTDGEPQYYNGTDWVNFVGGAPTGYPTVQERLIAGATPKQIYDSGFPVDSIIGMSYEGGVIGLFNTTDGTGVVVAPFDQGLPGTYWSLNNNSITTGGNGQTNTINIVTDQGVGNYAAYLCDTLTLNGKTDWYLPSLGELQSMGANWSLIGWNNAYYWSSNQNDNNTATAWFYVMGSGLTNIWGKTASSNTFIRVRAVRAF